MAKPFEIKRPEPRANATSRADANWFGRHYKRLDAIINEWVSNADSRAQFIASRHRLPLPIERVDCGLANIGLHAEGGAT